PVDPAPPPDPPGSPGGGCGTETTHPTHHPWWGNVGVARGSAAIARGKRPDTFRTRKLRLAAPMVLQGRPCGRVGHRRTFIRREPPKVGRLSLVNRNREPTGTT